MPDPVLPGLQQKNPDPLGGLTKEKVRRWLGLSDRKRGKLEDATPKKLDLHSLGSAAPIVNRILPRSYAQGPTTFSNVYDDDRDIYSQMIGASIQSMCQGIDWGVDSKTALKTGVFADLPRPPDTIPILGAVCTKEERTMGAREGITINGTYAVPAVAIQPENIMSGGTTGADTWSVWSTQATSINIQAANYAWCSWANNVAATTGTITIQASAEYIVTNNMLQGTWGNGAKKTHETEAQKKKRIDDQKVQEALWLEAEKRRQAQQNKVKVRAEKILVRHLSADQAATLKEKGYFDVDLADKVYRIWRGTHGNIKELSQDRTKEVASLCVQPNGVPTEDAMLAQLLWLRADEKALLRVANRTVLRT